MQDADLLDRFVNGVGDLLIRFGFNGARLKWKWHNYRSSRAAVAVEREVRFRGVTGRHKMCPSCRSLIPARAGTCPECGAAVAHVRGPGLSRLLEWIIPGVAPVTSAILTANILLFGLMALSAGLGADQAGGLSGMFRFLSFDMRTLIRFGLGYGPWIIGRGELWRLITPLFLHAGLLHLLFNSFALLQIGPLVEGEYGAAKMWVFYLVAGICGGVVSNFGRPILFGWNVPYVGASGAIFGMVGVALVFGWRRGGVYGNQIRRIMLQWTLYTFIYSFLLRADNFAHFGGLAGGAFLALVVPPGAEHRPGPAFVWRLLAWGGAAAVLWALLMASLHGAEALQAMFR